MTENKAKVPAVRSILLGLMIGIGAGLFLFALINLAGGFFTDTNTEVSSLQNSSGSPVIGKPAPDFLLENLEGQEVRLSDQKGKVVLVNFWATWCGPCIVEMPMFQQAYDSQNESLEILALNNMEDNAVVNEFVDEHKLSFPILLDKEANVALQYRVRAFPTTFIIDEEGIVRFQHIGFMTEEQFDNYLQKLGIS